MNNNNQESMNCIPGRAPSEDVWTRIEDHLDKRTQKKPLVPEWCYAVAVLSCSILIGVVVSAWFT